MHHPVILLVACGALAACRLSSEPSDPYGDYQLVGYESPFSQQTIPVTFADYAGSPGDSVRVLGGTFALRSDGRWRRERTTVNLRAGAWGSATTTSDSGTYGVVSGSGSNLSLMLMIRPTEPYEQATTNGKEFQEGVFVYGGFFIYSRR